jgi:hypothetical protein
MSRGVAGDVRETTDRPSRHNDAMIRQASSQMTPHRQCPPSTNPRPRVYGLAVRDHARHGQKRFHDCLSVILRASHHGTSFSTP